MMVHSIVLRSPESGKKSSILFTGDICPRWRGEERIRNGEAKDIIRNVLPLFEKSDLRIVQWETPLTASPAPIPKSGPNLICDPSCVELPRLLHADVALLANNHTVDHGPDACLETIRRLQDNGIRTVGAGATRDDAEAPLILDCCGRKIAILNVCEHEFGHAGKNRPGTGALNPIRNVSMIRRAKELADFVIMAVHGGNEHNPYPSPRMMETYRAFADAGADLVFNCHPHIPQGAEFYHGIPIVYSPGNFYFPKNSDSSYPASWNFGYMPRFLLDSKGVYAIEIHPFSFSDDSVEPLSGKSEEIFFERFKALCEPLADPEKIQSYFETWSAEHGWIYDYGTGKNVLPSNLDDPENVRQWLGLRNLFACEAHCEVSTTYLLLLEEMRLDEARKRYPLLTAFQQPLV